MKRDTILAKTDGRCAYCGCDLQDIQWHIEHMIPGRRGGKGGENLIASCPTCNLRKRSRTPAEFKVYLSNRVTNTIAQAIENVAMLQDYLVEEEDYQWSENLLNSLIDARDEACKGRGPEFFYEREISHEQV